MIAPVVLGLVAGSGLSRLGFRWAAGVGLGVTALLIAPLQSAAGAFMAIAILRFRSAAVIAKASQVERDACLEACELVALGLAGGLSVASAHQVAIVHAAPEARPALARLVADMEVVGTQSALAAVEGPMAEASRVVAAAAASGAPALPALAGYLEVESHRRHSEKVEAARRLPVRLLLPLTLLVLPGFILLTVGPAVIGSLARLNP